MFKRIKETLPDNRKTALLGIGVVFLIAAQVLAGTSSPAMKVLRYVFFFIAVGLYFYVAISHHKVLEAKKKARLETEKIGETAEPKKK